MNEELINSAVSFLKDETVSAAPIAKKVEFLETKGLNQEEIEEALKRASGPDHSREVAAGSGHQYGGPLAPPQAPIDYYNVAAPQVPERTWKDYFIMATATAGVTYGLYQIVSRYLIPSIIPPTQTSIDEDKEKIDEEFIKIDSLLNQLSTEQSEIKESNEQKLKEIDVVIENVNDFLSKYNKDKLKFDDDLRLMKLELDNLKNSIEKNMSLTKENIKDELEDIGSELTSLKQLIKARSEKNATSDSNSSARKITPASAIPSASEILRKAKQNSSANKSPEANKTQLHTQTQTPYQQQQPSTQETAAIPLAGATTVDGVSAAGIPEWQMNHKEQEERKEKNTQKQEEPALSQESNTTDAKPSIPAWQLNPDTEKNADDLVKESINRIGVPSWQLNTNKRDDESSEATQA